MSNIGRADNVLIEPAAIYIFEYKVDESAVTAIQQIKEKKYAQAFQLQKKPIYLIGINFSKEAHQLIYMFYQILINEERLAVKKVKEV